MRGAKFVDVQVGEVYEPYVYYLDTHTGMVYQPIKEFVDRAWVQCAKTKEIWLQKRPLIPGRDMKLVATVKILSKTST